MAAVIRVVSRDEFVAQQGGHRGRHLQQPLLYWTQWGGFIWECPRCGRAQQGELGPTPKYGGDGTQRWVNTGTLALPTLTPPLGCMDLLDHTCSGRYLLRDGVLQPA